MTFDVCVLGSFMKDLVAEAPRRPKAGATLRGNGFAEHLGGKGFNQAVAAARSGARTAMIGRVGADRYGEEFLELLAAEGIDTTHVRRDPVLGTGVGLPVVEPDGANSIIIVPRANDAVTPDDVAAAADVIRSSRILLVQLELPVTTAITALDLAHRAGMMTVLNPAPYVPLPPELLERVGFVVPNEVEAEALTGMPCTDDRVLEVAQRIRRELAESGAVLTLGARGAVVVDQVPGRHGPQREDEWRTSWLPAYPVNPVDTVGAGDAFCGALAARLAAGDPLRDAAVYASAAAGLATTTQGAAVAMPYHAEIIALLNQTEVETPFVPGNIPPL
jgi:ribokinase